MSINGIGGKVGFVRFDRRLMAFRNPWSPTEDLGELYMLRGAIISAFSHVDFIAMKISVCASRVSEYQIRPKPPTRTTERIQYIRDIIDIDGPLTRYRTIIGKAISKLEELNDYRTIVAHASVTLGPRRLVIFPEAMKVFGKNSVVSKHNSTSLDDLNKIAYKYAIFSRACQRLYYKLEESKILPTVYFHQGWHSSLSPGRDPLEIPWGAN